VGRPAKKNAHTKKHASNKSNYKYICYTNCKQFNICVGSPPQKKNCPSKDAPSKDAPANSKQNELAGTKDIQNISSRKRKTCQIRPAVTRKQSKSGPTASNRPLMEPIPMTTYDSLLHFAPEVAFESCGTLMRAYTFTHVS
jgi:hypothetical protein